MSLEGRTALLRRCHLAQAVGEKAQGTLRRNRRVELAHGAGRGVARIDEGLESVLALALVEAFEIVAPHVDLAAHFEHLGHFRHQ